MEKNWGLWDVMEAVEVFFFFENYDSQIVVVCLCSFFNSTSTLWSLIWEHLLTFPFQLGLSVHLHPLTFPLHSVPAAL